MQQETSLSEFFPAWIIRRFLFDILFRFAIISSSQVSVYFLTLLGQVKNPINVRRIRPYVHALLTKLVQEEYLDSVQDIILCPVAGQVLVQKVRFALQNPVAFRFEQKEYLTYLCAAEINTPRQTVYIAKPEALAGLYRPNDDDSWDILQKPGGHPIVSYNDLDSIKILARQVDWTIPIQRVGMAFVTLETFALLALNNFESKDSHPAFEPHCYLWSLISATELYITFALGDLELGGRWWSTKFTPAGSKYEEAIHAIISEQPVNFRWHNPYVGVHSLIIPTHMDRGEILSELASVSDCVGIDIYGKKT